MRDRLREGLKNELLQDIKSTKIDNELTLVLCNLLTLPDGWVCTSDDLREEDITYLVSKRFHVTRD